MITSLLSIIFPIRYQLLFAECISFCIGLILLNDLNSAELNVKIQFTNIVSACHKNSLSCNSKYLVIVFCTGKKLLISYSATNTILGRYEGAIKVSKYIVSFLCRTLLRFILYESVNRWEMAAVFLKI